MEYVAYRVRWIIIGAICATSIIRMYMALSFEMASDSIRKYLDVTAYQVDILATADAFMAVFVSLLMAVAGQGLGVRVQSLLASGCMLVGAGIVTFAMSDRSLYWCLVVGRLIAGIPAGLLYILPAAVANTWFPPREIATAFSLPLVGFSLGGAMAAIVFPSLLPTMDSQEESNFTDEATGNLERVQHVFILNMGMVTGILVISTLLLVVYAKDEPPTPPSRAQERLLADKFEGEVKKTSHFNNPIQTIRNLFKSRPFCLLTLANSLSNSSLSLAVILSPSLVHGTLPTLSDQSIGGMFVAVTVFGALGSIAAGRIMDKFGHYKDFAAFGTFVTVLVSIGLYFSHQFASQVSLFMLYPLLSFSRAFTVTSDTELLLETTYPSNGVVLTSLYFSFYNFGLFSFTSLERLIMNTFGEANAMWVSVFANFLSFACIVLVKAEYRRTKANSKHFECSIIRAIDGNLLDRSSEEKDELLQT